jgi:hypothetical protein
MPCGLIRAGSVRLDPEADLPTNSFVVTLSRLRVPPFVAPCSADPEFVDSQPVQQRRPATARTHGSLPEADVTRSRDTSGVECRRATAHPLMSQEGRFERWTGWARLAPDVYAARGGVAGTRSISCSRSVLAPLDRGRGRSGATGACHSPQEVGPFSQAAVRWPAGRNVHGRVQFCRLAGGRVER